MFDLKGLLNDPERSAREGSGILACAATGVDQAVLALNGDVEKLFASADIEYGAIRDPHTPIPLSSFCELYDNVARELDQPSFGLNVGANYQPVDLGVLGYLAANAPNLNTSLHCLTDYFNVLQQGTLFRLACYQGKPALEYRITDPFVRHRAQDAELSLAMFYNFMQLCFEQDSAVDEIQLQHLALNDSQVYEQFFAAPVSFSCDTNRIVFDSSLLDLKNKDADRDLFYVLYSLFQNHRSESRPCDILDQVKQCLAAHIESGDICLQHVADQLQLPVWTIQRKLADKGYSFKGLVEEVRKNMAMHYLSSNAYSITQIALMLGYSEVSAFSRAFKRWSGCSPAQFIAENST